VTSIHTSRPATAHINLNGLKHNVELVKKLVAPSKIMAVIKANGYGHGLIEAAQTFEAAKVHSLATAYVEEGIALRKAGIKCPILVMSGMLEGQIGQYIENDLQMVGLSLSKLDQIDEVAAKLKKNAKIHLKIDTGMNRIGQHYYSSKKLFEKAISLKHITIEGVMSHLACADDEDISFTKLQLERFLEAISFFEKHSLSMPLRHISNSAAAVRIPEAQLDMIRPGIILYGVSPFKAEVEASLNDSALSFLKDLQPAMEIKSQVVYFKVIKGGTGVSYGHSWKAPTDTRIVTVPIGYGDGLPRSISNKGSVIIKGKKYPIVGNVCMDQLLVNLGPDGEAYNGDEVIFVGQGTGDSGSEKISIHDLASWAGTIPHEILVSFNERLPRVYKS